MKYVTICGNCKFKSEPDEQVCPNCGAVNQQSASGNSFNDVLVDEISTRINFIDKPEIFIRLFFRVLLLAAGIFLIPDFIYESEIFLIALYLFALMGIIKEFDRGIPALKGIHRISWSLVAAYIGGGIGNFISYAGIYHGFKMGYFFNPLILWSGIKSGNFMIYLGALSGLGLFALTAYFLNMLNESNTN